MGKINLKINDGYYTEDRDIWNLLCYIVRDKRVGCMVPVSLWNTRGTLKSVSDAYKQMVGLQRFFEKDKERRMYHLMITFEENVKDLDLIRDIAEEVADYLGSERQLLYGIHTDKENYHIHLAMNAVSFRNGKKWHKDKKAVDKWIRHLKGIALKKLGAELVVENKNISENRENTRKKEILQIITS